MVKNFLLSDLTNHRRMWFETGRQTKELI